MVKTSKEYWRERLDAEANTLSQRTSKLEDDLTRLYDNQYQAIEKEINAFKAKYGDKEGISPAEVNKRISAMDVKAFENKAAFYVETKDFSPEANRELALYNLTMKVSRLELLQYNLDLELVALADGERKITEKFLEEEYIIKLRQQAGILGDTIPTQEQARQQAKSVINVPYHGAEWSQRLWDNQADLRVVVANLAPNTILRGKSGLTAISQLRKEFDVSDFVARRLAVTETGRIQSEAQKQAYLNKGTETYVFVPEPKACDVCLALKDKEFPVAEMTPGVNACPMHPWCRCTTVEKSDRDELNRMFEEYEKLQNSDIISEKDVFQSYFDGFDTNRGRRIMAKDVLNRLNVPTDKISIRKIDARGFNALGENPDGTIRITEFALQSDDNRTEEYQIKTLFHESYHSLMSGKTIDRATGSFGRIGWLDIEETFAETSSHYAVKALGIDKKLAPAYPDVLVNTLPRLKQLDNYKNASTLADFGKIAWEDRLKGTPSQWESLANQLDNIDHDWRTYGLQYESYIEENRDSLFTNFIENSPQYNQSFIIERMKDDLDNALLKTNYGQPLNGNEVFVYSGILSTAMNQIGVK